MKSFPNIKITGENKMRMLADKGASHLNQTGIYTHDEEIKTLRNKIFFKIFLLIFIIMLFSVTSSIFGQETWTATSTSNAPDARAYQTALWTGSKMIIWGGAGTLGNLYYNTGGMYDPLNNSWNTTSTSNAPGGRDYHSAIWTGSALGGKMIVWGGYDGYTFLNTGGIYDPSNNSWSTISTTNTPSARYMHTAVWTGSKMIIWGGFVTGSGYVNTGGVYDPATDSWTSMSVNNAPSVRGFHTAIWTGSKMIVWGGFDGTNIFYSGGIYDPVNDSWTATSIVNAPSARDLHSAVWTGNKMIIFGGFNGAGSINTGAIYDPTNDSWAATSTVNAPTSRLHTAIWTGSATGGKMINLGWICGKQLS